MAYVSDRVPSTHRHVAKGFSVTAFDPAREQLPASRWVKYKAGDGHLFEFVPVRLPSGVYRAYIRRQPGYGTRPTAAGQTHRLTDQHGQYICWTPEPTDVGGLIKVMRVWAESTVGYIRTGTFGPLGRS